MKRRGIVSLSSAVALAAALPVAAQPRRVPALGLLGIAGDSAPQAAMFWKPFWAELNRLGWEDGRSLRVERAFAGPNIERLPALAQELVRKDVGAIQAINNFSAVAAARASRTIPIVFFYVDNPVERGLVSSLARPGRNLTGFTHNTGLDQFNKRLQMLRELAPSAKRLAWLWMLPGDDTATVSGAVIDHRGTIRSVAMAQGFESRFHDIRKREDLDKALVDIAAWPADAIASAAFIIFAQARQTVAEVALRHRIATVIDDLAAVEAGCLFCYEIAGSEIESMAIRNAGYIDRILRGTEPADLPVEQPGKFELVINAGTARTLGIPIPQSMLLRADRVIG